MAKKKTTPKKEKVSEKQKTAIKLAKIKWKVKEVPVNKITPTEVNYKIKTELGRERLQQSLKMFGLAGTVVCNAPNKKGEYNLIDGNSRLQEAIEAGEKKLNVSYPDRALTPKEFKEMSAMFDYAKAGEVDMDRIHQDLGTTEDFYKRWQQEVPLHILEKMGAKMDTSEFEFPGKTSSSDKGGSKATPAVENDIQMVQLFFSKKQEAEFRKMEEKLAKKFKTTNTTMTVFKALKSIVK